MFFKTQPNSLGGGLREAPRRGVTEGLHLLLTVAQPSKTPLYPKLAELPC
jgi:hypothetical protein